MEKVTEEEFSIHEDNWVNVVDNRDDYEFLFTIPTEEDLKQLKESDMVKISNGFERFFVRIIEIRDDCFIGMIDNHLRGSYDYDYGDKVRFYGYNIFTVRKQEEQEMKPNDINKKRNKKTTARMMKMLGKDPLTSTQEMKLFETILNQK